MISIVKLPFLAFVLSDELVAFTAFLLLYLSYFFASEFPFVKRYLSRFQETDEEKELSIYMRRVLGLFLLGIIPFLIVLFFFARPITDYGVGLPSGKYVLLWVLIPTIVITLGSILQPNHSIDTNYYPEVRKLVWTKRRTMRNAFYWTLYLLGYEFAIRGMLFFACLYAFGMWPAIIINSVIYSLIHIFKGYKEAFGAFFLGVLFCIITYYTNSIWIAFVIHVLIAVINDIKAVKASKNMKYDLEN